MEAMTTSLALFFETALLYYFQGKQSEKPRPSTESSGSVGIKWNTDRIEFRLESAVIQVHSNINDVVR